MLEGKESEFGDVGDDDARCCLDYSLALLLLFFWWSLRGFRSAFGGLVLRMSEDSISRQCDAMVWCGDAVLKRPQSRVPVLMLSHQNKGKVSVFMVEFEKKRHSRMQSKSVKTADPMQVQRHERAASQFSPV